MKRSIWNSERVGAIIITVHRIHHHIPCWAKKKGSQVPPTLTGLSHSPPNLTPPRHPLHAVKPGRTLTVTESLSPSLSLSIYLFAKPSCPVGEPPKVAVELAGNLTRPCPGVPNHRSERAIELFDPPFGLEDLKLRYQKRERDREIYKRYVRGASASAS